MINIGYNEKKAYFIILYWSKKHTITFKMSGKMPVKNSTSNLKASIFRGNYNRIFNFLSAIIKIKKNKQQQQNKTVNFYSTAMFRFWCLQFEKYNKNGLLNLSQYLQCSRSPLSRSMHVSLDN